MKEYSPNIPPENFTSLSRLDQNRSVNQIAKKFNVKISEIKNVIAWGNHNSTVFPDLFNASINGKKIIETLDSLND